jgi:hypothetical protein
MWNSIPTNLPINATFNTKQLYFDLQSGTFGFSEAVRKTGLLPANVFLASFSSADQSRHLGVGCSNNHGVVFVSKSIDSLFQFNSRVAFSRAFPNEVVVTTVEPVFQEYATRFSEVYTNASETNIVDVLSAGLILGGNPMVTAGPPSLRWTSSTLSGGSAYRTEGSAVTPPSVGLNVTTRAFDLSTGGTRGSRGKSFTFDITFKAIETLVGVRVFFGAAGKSQSRAGNGVTE